MTVWVNYFHNYINIPVSLIHSHINHYGFTQFHKSESNKAQAGTLKSDRVVPSSIGVTLTQAGDVTPKENHVHIHTHSTNTLHPSVKI